MQINLNHNTTTEFDKNIEVLGRQLGKCKIHLYGSKCCSKEECGNCETGEMVRRCLNEMAVCDRLRVEQIAEDIFGHYLFENKLEKKNRVSGLLIAFACVFCLTAFWALMMYIDSVGFTD
jgi:hypothetical protein